MRHYRHLKWSDRLYIERLLKKGYKKPEIAEIIGCSLATVYNELKRGSYEHQKSDLTFEIRYSPDKAQNGYNEKLRRKGSTPKLLRDPHLCHYIEEMIVTQHYSPEAALYEIAQNHLSFAESISSVQTVYAGIRRGYFERISMMDLPRRGKVKRKRQRVMIRPKLPAGTSIELRAPEIETRETFGHWEMDSLCGKMSSKATALVLTERKTRFEIVERLRNHTSAEVVHALNRIEKRLGKGFYSIFQSITVDGGSEFADYKSLEKAYRRKNERTKLYYCHPRSPNERGSNEVANALLRRCPGLEKGGDFDQTLTYRACKDAQFWINTYPRGLFGGRCSMDLFREELERLSLSHVLELC